MQASIDEVGRNSEDAIHKALKKIGLSREKVMVEVLSDMKGYNTSLARVRVIPLGQPPDPLNAGPILEELLEKMGFSADIAQTLHDNEITLTLNSEMSGLIIGKNGITIDALQHILNRILTKRYQGKWKAVVDIEGYRHRRASYLINLARRSAETAKETREAVELPPLNPHDRRIIHLELESDRDVRTASQGEGFLKVIRITPLD
ncbi:KH domain-containing protein [bacterium]|nr:KH domain-containing protein [bacterium]